MFVSWESTVGAGTCSAVHAQCVCVCAGTESSLDLPSFCVMLCVVCCLKIGRSRRHLHFLRIITHAAPSRLFEPVMQPPAALLCAGLTEPAESRCSLYTCTSNLCICTNIHLCFGGQLSLLGVLPHPRRARRA